MDDHSSLEAIFFAALEIGLPEERAGYLDTACAGDPELRRRVEKMLAAQGQADSFLEQPAANLLTTADHRPVAESLGTVIGPYKLLQQIGEGGMGTVFMAEQTHPVQRKVALKIIKPGMDSRQVIARFEAERQALALMDHPNISKVLDAGTTDAGRPYFVMELVKGILITKYCDEHRLTPRQRLELFIPVCQAIQHAHQKGIIHRDIKPSNVLVCIYDGKPSPKVIDFGVAKATGQKLTDRTLYTEFGAIVGTVEYMSPEQAQLDQLDVDTRSDIFSLGVLLYELLTGTTPLQRKRVKEVAVLELLRLVREEEPPRPSTRLSTTEELPSIAASRGTEPKKLSGLMRGELDWIVLKCLEKDRDRRYETANAFAQDVQRYLADEPVMARPPSTWYRLRKLARRNKASIATAMAVAVAVVFAVVALAFSNVRIGQEKDQKDQALQQARINEEASQEYAAKAQTEQKRAVEQERIATKEGRLARQRLYAAQMNLAQQAADAGDAPRVLELLEGQRPKFDQEDLRRFEWYYLWGFVHREQKKTLGGSSDAVLSLAYSPDGQLLATGDREGTVRLWHVATGAQRVTLRGHTGIAWSVAFSPDGKTLATAGADKMVKLWDIATGQERTVFKGHTDEVRCVAFSPDGKTLVSGSSDRRVKTWDLATREARTYDQGDGLRSLVFSPDGKTLASSDLGRRTVKLWHWDGAALQERASLTAGAGGEPVVAFSPDSKTLATTGTEVKLWDVATGAERTSLQGHTGIVHSVAFSPDGKSLASGGNDRTIKLWDLATRQARTLGVHRAPVLCLAFSPDGKVVGSGGEDGTVTLSVAADASRPGVLAHTGAVEYLAFSAAGNTLLAGGVFPTTIWDLATGAKRTALPVQSDHLAASTWKITPIAISPDGNTLAYVKGTTIKLWDMGSGRERGTLQCPSEIVTALTFSPDGKTLATVGSWPITFQMWDLAALRPKITFRSGRAVVYSMAFAPNGETLAAGGQFGVVTVWDVATGKHKATVQERGGAWGRAAVTFSPDGKTLATGDNLGVVRLWEAATGQLLACFKGHTDDVRSLAFFPDGRTLVTGSDDGTVRLWDLAAGQEKGTLRGHKSAVATIAISPDGNILASGSADGTVKLWRAATNAEAVARQTEDDPDNPDSPRAQIVTGDRLLSQGRSLEAEKTYRGALARLHQLVAANPTVPVYQEQVAHSWFGLSVLLLGNARRQEAEEARDQARKIQQALPQDQKRSLARFYRDLSYLLGGAGHTAEAVSAGEQAVQLLPEDSLCRYCRAYDYETAGQYDKALADYSKAIELNPTDARFWSGRAYVYLKTGEHQKALHDFTKELELEPGNAGAMNNRGIAYENLGSPEEALADFSKAIELAPKDALHWSNRARIRIGLGRWDKGIVDFSKAIELAPEEARYRYLRAGAYFGHQLYAKAIADFSKVIELKPDYAEAWNDRGAAHGRRNQVEDAISDYSEAIKLKPDFALALQNRASLYAAQGQSDKASADFAKLVKLTPSNAVEQNNLAWFLATCLDPKLRDPTKAVELAKKATDLMPQEGNHWNTLGVAHYRAGEWKAAIEVLEKSKALQGDNSLSFNAFFLAMAHWQLGSRDEARRWYDLAVGWMETNKPQDEELRRFRAEAEELLKIEVETKPK